MNPVQILLSEILDWLPTLLCVGAIIGLWLAWKWGRA